MKRALLFVLLVVLVPFASAADAPDLTLIAAYGTVDKVEKDTLTLKPRRPDGKFDKVLSVKLTGTSKIAVASTRETAGKTTVVQREIDKGDLKAGQTVALIYTTLKDGNVLLTAVVLPAPAK